MAAQPRLIKVMEPLPQPEIPNIPFFKYELDNGLILIVHEDHSDPIVHVDVTYHVGSAREEIGMSGFAHFFEHMMFQGSKHVGDEEHFKIINGAGGTMNGTTNRDRTNYYETVPKNYLETALWLEADRMGFLLEAVTQKKFEVQRSTVKNEKGQNYENRPYGMVSETSAKNFYSFGHPYSWPTIGYVDDLNRVGVEDLKKFFLRWYGPNNAVLTVGGDVDHAEVAKLVQKYFGAIPRGPEVERMSVPYFYIEKDRYISLEDNVRFPMLRMQWPAVGTFKEDEAPLDILAELLGQGKNSILYQNFVKTQKAVQAMAFNPTFELSGEFTVSIQAYPGTKLSEMEALLRQSIEEFGKKEISDEDLAKAKASREAAAIYGLESVAGKVSQLAMYEYLTGNPDYIKQDVYRYTAVTKEDVMRVYRTYILNQPSLILSVYPKGQKELIAAPDNYTAGGDSGSVARTSYDTLALRPVKDNFNRAKRPKPGPTPIVIAPGKQTFSTPMGMTVTYAKNTEVPMIYFQMSFKAGRRYQDKAKAGIANLTARMLQESSMGMSAEEIEKKLDLLGTRVNVSTDDEDITISMTCLSKNFEASMMVLTDMVMHPKFSEEEFNRVKQQVLEQIANQTTQAGVIATQTYNRLIYGPDHIYSISTLGTQKSVESIAAKDLRGYHAGLFTMSNCSIFASGNIEPQALERTLMMLMMRPRGLETTGELPTPPTAGKTKIYLVNKDGAPQSEIRVGYLALPYDATGEYYKATVMNYILGGAFNSRINLNLREDKGYTYGARSFFNGSHTAGPWTVSTGVRGNATDSAVIEILKEIKEYREEGITKDELAFTKSSLLEREALKYETNAAKARFLQHVKEYNLPEDYIRQQAGILKKLKKKEIKKLAQKHLPIDNMVIVVVGDAKSVKPGLQKIGYEVEEIDMSVLGFKN